MTNTGVLSDQFEQTVDFNGSKVASHSKTIGYSAGRRRDEIVSELQFWRVALRNEAVSEGLLTCHMTLVQDTIGNLFAKRTAILGGGPGVPGSEGAAS
jgi:hypothetical protein